MTGLAADQVNDLVARVAAHGLWPLQRRRALDPHQSVTAVLLYLRHNLSQPLPAELFHCSQPSRSTTPTTEHIDGRQNARRSTSFSPRYSRLI
jgi:hypothetical protein